LAWVENFFKKMCQLEFVKVVINLFKIITVKLQRENDLVKYLR